MSHSFQIWFLQSSGYSSGQQVTSNSPPCLLIPFQVYNNQTKSNLSSNINSSLLQINLAHQRANVFFNYLTNCHDLWEQADTLIIRGNHKGKLFFLDESEVLFFITFFCLF